MIQNLHANGLDVAGNGRPLATLDFADGESTTSMPELHLTAESLPPSADLLHLASLVTVGELSACFAHDIFNPLMLIRGHLQLIEEGLPEDHPLRVKFDVISRASRRIEDIARRMLDFSRKRSPRLGCFDVAELIEDAVRFMQPYFREHDIAVNTHAAPGLPSIHGDRAQMVQALVNLLQNAAEAMSNSQCRIVSVAASMEGNTMRIFVSDTGPGIHEADLPQIFSPFFTTKGERGTGLGLYITKKIIDDQGGTISVRTSPRGTSFILDLSLPQTH